MGVAVAVLTAGAAVLLTAGQPAAHAVDDPATPVTANATWFTGLGGPYGGCGMTQDALETQDFVALNVYDTPGSYEFYNRPMPAGDPHIGMWNNGHNCGRWVQVSIGDYCTGVNDGARSLPFCRNGSWTADRYNGATLNMLVADSCGDDNAWCRDDPYHLDLAKASLNRFMLNGAPVADMDPDHWNNRHINWKFIPAPNYSGDIQIGFLQGAQTWWPAIAVSHLANGIHGIQSWSDGAWVDATMDGDMGQAYIIKPLTAGDTRFAIRVRDVSDTYLNDGRVYGFELPTSCDPQCGTAYTKISYTTSTTPPGPDGSSGSSGSSSGGTAKACTATARTAQSWPGGFQTEVTVKAGPTALRGWTVSWTLDADQSLRDLWNGSYTTSAGVVTARNASYNGAVTANGSTTFGYIGVGTPSVPTMTCTGT